MYLDELRILSLLSDISDTVGDKECYKEVDAIFEYQLRRKTVKELYL